MDNSPHTPDDKRPHRRGNLWHGVVALCLLAYMVVAITLAGDAHDSRMCTGMRIAVSDTSAYRFVTPAELGRELGDLPGRARSMRLTDIDTDSIERLLAGIDKIESSRAVRLTNGEVLITVHPMQPVARVFDPSGSYYINRSGKRISAEARYHIDVPLIQGSFADSSFTPDRLLPLIDYIEADSLWRSFISMIKVDSPHDVLLVPIVRGQIINFGEPTDFKSKFERLRLAYTEIMPVKGWNYYDTISVKWGGQIVATRRNKRLDRPQFFTEDDEETVDVGTMLTAEGVAPGQTRPGVKAENAIPMPPRTRP